MSKFLKALAKVGLVELDSEQSARLEADMPAEEARRLVQEAQADRSARQEPERSARPAPERVEATEPRSSPPDPAKALLATGIEESRPFEEIYSASGVPSSPFSAEKLLRVLEGLRAMDSATRTAAILAMDAADDDWTIDDPVLDAERKIRVLEEAKNAIRTEVAARERQAADELSAIAQYQEEATASIRKQITDLEALLERELGKAAEEKAASQHRVQASRQAAARETTRLDQEIGRLRTIALTFGSSGARTDDHQRGS